MSLRLRITWTSNNRSGPGNRLTQLRLRTKSERLARFIGTPRFLFVQTLIVALWLLGNILLEVTYLHSHPHCIVVRGGRALFSSTRACTGGVRPIDPYPFTFLTLMLSVQAAYAAPLILMAESRQAGRDAIEADIDRSSSQQHHDDVELLLRDVKALQRQLSEAASRWDVRREFQRGLLGASKVEERALRKGG